MAADGTGRTHISGPGPRVPGLDWSPDGQRLVFEQSGGLGVINVNGTGFGTISADTPAFPAWSPDGTRIAYSRYASQANGLDIETVKPDSTGKQTVVGTPNNDEQPDWSPDGRRIIFNRDYDLLYTVKPDGTDLTPIPGSHSDIGGHAWSPDGTRLAVARFIAGSQYDIYTTSAAGGSASFVFSSPGLDYDPDWTADPLHGLCPTEGRDAVPHLPGAGVRRVRDAQPRARAAACLRLVQPAPAHVRLAHGRHRRLQRAADEVGRLGAPRRDRRHPGHARGRGGHEDAGPDQRRANQSDLSDYTGELSADMDLRITDKNNAVPPGGGTDPATLIDIPFPLPQVSCVSTADPTIGGQCDVTTTLDALIPAAVKEGKRSIWQLSQVVVFDGGSDGQFGTTPNTVFLKEGIFVP